MALIKFESIDGDAAPLNIATSIQNVGMMADLLLSGPIHVTLDAAGDLLYFTVSPVLGKMGK